MDSRILDPSHAQFGGSLGGMVSFPYHLSHHHVYELAGHQLQSTAAVPFSIDGLLNGSCTASVVNSNHLLSSGCGMNGDSQQYKLTGKQTHTCLGLKKKKKKSMFLSCCSLKQRYLFFHIKLWGTARGNKRKDSLICVQASLLALKQANFYKEERIIFYKIMESATSISSYYFLVIVTFARKQNWWL